MSQTDAQAAMTAAAQVIAACAGRGPAIQDHDLINVERHTIAMADAFMAWLKRSERTTVERHVDERLVPNEDFRSPSHAQTERINPNDVTFAAAERERMASAALAAAAEPTMPWRTASYVVGPHTLSPTRTTPSGARACECGEKWPCSRARLDRAP